MSPAGFDINTWRKWSRWVDRIQADLSQIVEDQTVFNGFREVVQENGDWIDSNEGGFFLDFVRRCYVDHAFMGLRRQLKASRDSISLVGLLEEVHGAASRITYAFYLKVFPVQPEQVEWQWQQQTFRGFSKDGQVVSSELVQSDLAEAKALTAEIEKLADRTIAHLDRRITQVPVTFDDLNAAIDHFNKLACKYIAFITGRGWHSVGASIVFNWQEIFHHPLVKP